MKKIDYNTLNPKQKESYNYQKISAVLAEYGFTTYRMHDDYHGADFHAVHTDGHVLKVQLKGRVSVHSKYLGKDLHIAFPINQEKWYLYPHDKIHEVITNHSDGAKQHGDRSIGYIPKWLQPHLDEWEI